MKVYQNVAWVTHTYYDKIDMAKSEVQYSTCATDNQIVYSALILAYTEE